MHVNPFDIRTVLLARHAQHVVFIHFPIALFTIAVTLDFLAPWTKSRTLLAAAYFDFLIAAVFTVSVVGTGLVSLEGQKLKGILLLHLVLGSIESADLFVVLDPQACMA